MLMLRTPVPAIIGRRIVTSCAAAALFLASGAQANPSQVGEWGPLIGGFPVPAVHSLLLHTNKLLFFRGDGEDEGGVGVYRSHILNLETFEFETTFQMDSNVFCSGHSYLPDGRIVLSGGEKEEDLGPRYVHTFDPITERWNREPNMRDGRYYPTNTALGDGTTLFFAGRDPDGGNNPNVERFIPAGGQNGENLIEYIAGADKAMTWYPRMHLLPDGRVFRAGQERDSLTFNPDTGTWHLVARSNYGERYWGTSVALPPSQEKIMILGGLDRSATNFATETVEIIDLSQANPQWRYSNPMHNPRMHLNVVLLPNGKVFVAGGTEDEAENVPVYDSEMFDPETEQWTILPRQASVRTYHSTSLLLPDGRVMWLGAYTDTGGNTDNTAQIYSPAYLFQGYRPTLVSAPESADYGESITITTPDAPTIASVVLIRPSATTHAVNMEQRYVPVDFTQVDANTLQVSTPTNPNEAPPGYYMLFLVDDNGVPAVAPFIRLGGNLPPNVYAGEPQDIILPASAELDGTVTIFDESGNTTITWSSVSGPAPVAFANPNAEDTTATFSVPGQYVLRLTAESTDFSPVSDTIEIEVFQEGRIQVRVDASSDDAEETASSSMKLTSLDLEMFDYDSGGPHTAIGLRFDNVAIANGTQVGNAYVQFTADTSTSDASIVSISGEAADDAPTFSSAQGDITSRSLTNANVTWTPDGWTEGAATSAEASTNISSIIQEIVNRPGWTSGNALVLVFSGNGNRVAKSFDASPLNAPVLHVDPATDQACDDGLDNDLDGTIDYPDDPGCNSSSDPSERESSRVCDDGIDNDGDGLIDYPDDSGCYSLIDGSESEFESLCIDGLDNDGDGLIDFPEDPGCASGDDNDERGATFACDDGADNDGDALVDFPNDPGCASATDPSEIDGLVIADFAMQHPDDDSEQKADGSITLTSSDLEMLDYDAGGPHLAVGIRFTDLDLPADALVTTAHIQFTAAATGSSASNLAIHGENSDSALPFTSAPFDLTDRNSTSAVVSWSPPPWVAGTSGPEQRTSDLAPIINEIVSREGWSNGGAIAFIITGSGGRVAHSFDAAPAESGTLHVEYFTEQGGSNTPPSVSIVSPASGSTFEEGTEIAFLGTAQDEEDGDLADFLVWTSDAGESLGTGGGITVLLPVGTHVITASVTDNGGLAGQDQASVTVTPQLIDVPYVIGVQQSAAEEEILAAGLTVGSVSFESNEGVPAGTVIDQYPVACTACAEPDSAVDLVVSDGPSPNNFPIVSIISPRDGDVLSARQPVELVAEATDLEDGDISANVSWSSSKDGFLGVGAAIDTNLSNGRHILSATISDNGGLGATASVSVRVNRK